MTKEEQAKLRELHTAQMTVKEIAERMQKPKAEIRSGLVAMGYLPIEKKETPESEFLKGRQPVEIPTRKYQKITPEVEKRICELREQQFSAHQIAGKIGLSAPTVRKVLREHGYDTRRKRTKQDAAVPGKTREDKPMKPQININVDIVADQLLKKSKTDKPQASNEVDMKKEPAPVAADTSSETIIPVINDNTPEPKCQDPEPLSAISMLTLMQNMIEEAYGLEAQSTYIKADRKFVEYNFAYEGREYGFTFGLIQEVPEYKGRGDKS